MGMFKWPKVLGLSRKFQHLSKIGVWGVTQTSKYNPISTRRKYFQGIMYLKKIRIVKTRGA